MFNYFTILKIIFVHSYWTMISNSGSLTLPIATKHTSPFFLLHVLSHFSWVVPRLLLVPKP
jgi:hypothetical protein